MSAAQLCSCTKGPVRNRRKRVCMASFAPAGCLACSFVAQHNRASNRLERLEGAFSNSPSRRHSTTSECLLPACQCLPVPVGVRLGRAKLGAIVWAFPKSHQLINPSAGCPSDACRRGPHHHLVHHLVHLLGRPQVPLFVAVAVAVAPDRSAGFPVLSAARPHNRTTATQLGALSYCGSHGSHGTYLSSLNPPTPSMQACSKPQASSWIQALPVICRGSGISPSLISPTATSSNLTSNSVSYCSCFAAAPRQPLQHLTFAGEFTHSSVTPT